MDKRSLTEVYCFSDTENSGRGMRSGGSWTRNRPQAKLAAGHRRTRLPHRARGKAAAKVLTTPLRIRRSEAHMEPKGAGDLRDGLERGVAACAERPVEALAADPRLLGDARHAPLSQRAKIFIPFDPLKGYQEALRAKEREAEVRVDERAHVDEPA